MPHAESASTPIDKAAEILSFRVVIRMSRLVAIGADCALFVGKMLVVGDDVGLRQRSSVCVSAN